MALEPLSNTPSDWLLWQLADSAFPTGGFAHSLGLEAAWHHGEVRTSADLAVFLGASTHQCAHASVPFVTATFDDPRRLTECDRLCDAFTSNHVANRASRLQGRSWLTAVYRIFPESQIGSQLFAHYAPVFGASLNRLGLSRCQTVRLFLFNHVRALVAAAVRLNITGPMEAQAVQRRFAVRTESIAAKAERLTLDNLAQTAPLLELWQGTHDRLYSRLFQS